MTDRQPPPTLGVVIPVYNRFDLTRECLRSLRAALPGTPGVRVAVVDNGSSDETASACGPFGAALFGEGFLHLRLETNLGFAAACNRGAEAAGAELLFFLNNDAFLEPGAVAPLLGALAAEELSGVGPLLAFPGAGRDAGRVQHLGVAGTFGLGVRHLHELIPVDHSLARRRRLLRAVSAAALLVPASLFRDYGGFFEGYRNGLEDVDFCQRVARGGGRFRCVPESRGVHLAGQSEGRFAAESANVALFRARCPDWAPDLARLLREDGLSSRLSPWLSLYASPGPEEAEAMGARLKESAGDVDGLAALTLESPYFEPAYVALAEGLTAAGRPTGVLEALRRRSELCPSLEAFRALARAAGAVGEAVVEEGARRVLSALGQAMADAPGLARRARGWLRRAEADGDVDSQAVLRAWLAERGLAGRRTT